MTDGHCAFAFAEAIVADMRVRHVLVVCCGMRIGCDHGITQLLPGPAQIKFNAERTEIDILQNNGFGDDRNRSRTEVKLDIHKFVEQAHQFRVKFPQGRTNGGLTLLLFGLHSRQRFLEFP